MRERAAKCRLWKAARDLSNVDRCAADVQDACRKAQDFAERLEAAFRARLNEIAKAVGAREDTATIAAMVGDMVKVFLENKQESGEHAQRISTSGGAHLQAQKEAREAAKAEAELKARQEAERKAKEEAERKAKEEAERNAPKRGKK